jgi:hypothetical protein
MATKKKTGMKSTRSKKRETGTSQPPAKERLAKPKPVQNRIVARKKTPAKTASAKGVNKTRQYLDEPLSSLEESSRKVSGLQSGDLQGLSNVEGADSESVDELLEEGNAFEAGIVSGVEDSLEREGHEVRTREVPEDDVPDEYLNQD